MRAYKTKLLIASFLATLFLSGCQSAIYGENAGLSYDSFANRQEKLNLISKLDLQGRFGMITTKERLSANFEYQLDGYDYSLEVTTPAGSQAALLKVSKDGKTSLSMGNKRYKGDDPRALFLQEFGIDLPFSMLKQILLGIPDGVKSFDKQGRAVTAETYEFTITMGSYRNFKGYDLPTLFNITSPKGSVIIKVNRLLKIE